MMKKSNIFQIIATFAASIMGVISAQASTITIPGGSVKSLAQAPDASEVTSFFAGFKTIGVAISGICAITGLIFFVINLTRLSTSVSNDMQRSRAIKGLLYSGVALALFGSITVVAGIFWNAI